MSDAICYVVNVFTRSDLANKLQEVPMVAMTVETTIHGGVRPLLAGMWKAVTGGKVFSPTMKDEGEANIPGNLRL